MAKKPAASRDSDNTSKVEVLVAKYGLVGVVVTAILGLIGVVIAAYFGYLGQQTQVQAPIAATQTAESNAQTKTPFAVEPNAPAPTSHVWLSPYQDSFIELIFATPSLDQNLVAAEDIPYSYIVRYFVPDFDWQGSGIEPRIQLERVVDADTGMNVALLNDYPAEIGEATTINIAGRFIVPSDRDTWTLRLKIFFRESDGGGISGGNILIPFDYSVSESQ